MALQDQIIQRLRNAGLQVADVRGQLPRNGTWLKRPVSAIKIISGHWDAEWRPTDYDSLARYVGQARYHINKDWGGGAHGDGLMYAWKFDNLGTVFITRDLEDVLWSVGDQNYVTASYCFDGTTGQEPTQEQIAAEQKFLDVICFQCPEFPASQGDVLGHQEVPGNSTACPGSFLASIQSYRAERNTHAERYAPNYGIPAPAPAPTIPTPPPTPEPAPAPVQPAPEPPVVPTPQPPVPGTVVQPEPGKGGVTGQVSGEVPVRTPETATPVLEDLPPLPEFQETFKPFAAGTTEIHLNYDTNAIDLSGAGEPKPVSAAYPMLSSGTMTDAGHTYYRGTSGGWYGVPAEAVQEANTEEEEPVPFPAWAAAIGNFLRDPFGWIVRLFSKLNK